LGNGRGVQGVFVNLKAFLQPSSPHRPSSSPLLPYLQELGIMHESLQLFTVVVINVVMNAGRTPSHSICGVYGEVSLS